jgi:hypothetical protein
MVCLVCYDCQDKPLLDLLCFSGASVWPLIKSFNHWLRAGVYKQAALWLSASVQSKDLHQRSKMPPRCDTDCRLSFPFQLINWHKKIKFSYSSNLQLPWSLFFFYFKTMYQIKNLLISELPCHLFILCMTDYDGNNNNNKWKWLQCVY